MRIYTILFVTEFAETTIKSVFLHLDKSVQIVRARNITWQSYGFRGSNNFSIAVLDTGIDDSHLDLLGFQNLSFNSSVKIVGWKDTTADNILAPVDFNGHGSHVAGTIAGLGAKRFFNRENRRDFR